MVPLGDYLCPAPSEQPQRSRPPPPGGLVMDCPSDGEVDEVVVVNDDVARSAREVEENLKKARALIPASAGLVPNQA